ncbi:hypothetical protein V6N12_069838 [Hibiscus sabdariffa]|uniref:RNase H type-1 domain-containing protein n=1 Tax=Hibiscus sabdariffa TaxID=183260 RepID=A0ABR2FF27_9ROSI
MSWKRRCRFVMEHGFFEPNDMFTLCSRLAMEFARCKDAWLGGNALVDDIQEFLSQDWKIIIRKIPMEMNKVTDALARSSLDGSMRVLLFNVPSIGVQHLVLMDKQSVDDVMVSDDICRS